MYSFNRVLLLCPIKWSESMQYSHSLSWSSFLIFKKGGGGWGTCGYTSQVKEGWIWGYKSDTVHIRIISAFSKQKQKEHKFKVSLDYTVKIYFKQNKTKKRVTDNAMVVGIIINMVLEAAIYYCKCVVGLLANQVYEYASKKHQQSASVAQTFNPTIKVGRLLWVKKASLGYIGRHCPFEMCLSTLP